MKLKLFSAVLLGTALMATPALAKFGSDELRREFLASAISGEYVASIAVSEPGAGSDVAATAIVTSPSGRYAATPPNPWNRGFWASQSPARTMRIGRVSNVHVGPSTSPPWVTLSTRQK